MAYSPPVLANNNPCIEVGESLARASKENRDVTHGKVYHLTAYASVDIAFVKSIVTLVCMLSALFWRAQTYTRSLPCMLSGYPLESSKTVPYNSFSR